MADADWKDDDTGDWVDDHHDNKHSALASGVMHGLQGATGGFMDELQGAGEVAGRALGVEGAGGPMKDMGLAPGGPTLDWETLRDAYKKARDHERKMLKEQSDEHPIASGAGELGGMIVSPLNKIGAGVSLAKGGAALGGINALGSSEASDLKGMAKDTSLGVGLGAGLGKVADKASPYLEKGIEKVGSGARSLADSFAARALGAERGTIKSLGIDKVKAAGRQALDEGMLSPLTNVDDLVAKNKALQSKGGDMMGEAYKAIDDAGVSTFHPHDAAEAVEKELAPTWRTAINKGETNQFDNTLESILARGNGDIPLKEAQLLKEELGSAANWKNNLNVTAKEQMARDAYKIVSQQIDDAAGIGAKAIGSEGLSNTLAQGKDIYSKAKTGEKLLQNKQAREQGNSFVGLTDAVTGAGALGYGGATDDWKGAAGIMAGKKILGKYGAQNAALGLNKVSKMLMQSPKFADLAAKSPQAFNALANNFAKKLEGKMMPKAADKGAGEQNHVISEDEAKQQFLDGN